LLDAAVTEEVEAAAIASSAACRLELATVVLSPSILAVISATSAL